MNECKFEYDERASVFRCSVCGREIKAPKDTIVSAYCQVQEQKQDEPNLRKKIVHYVEAVIQHYATGAKTRTDEEVEQLLTICQQCEKYNAVREYCRVCGCKCNNLKNAFLNKLRMESQHCPEKKW